MRRLFLLFLAVAEPSIAASPETWFGFSIGVEVNWAFNLKSATVNHVLKGSAAEKAGVAVGDQITNIEGCTVPGCGAYKAKGLMEKPVGEAVHLRLKHQDGEEYAATLLAEPMPQK